MRVYIDTSLNVHREISQRRHCNWQKFQKAYHTFHVPWRSFYLPFLTQLCRGKFFCGGVPSIDLLMVIF